MLQMMSSPFIFLIFICFLFACDYTPPQECARHEQRCNGDIKQVCNLKGKWDDLSCPTGYSCFDADGIPTCQPNIYVTAGMMTSDMQVYPAGTSAGISAGISANDSGGMSLPSDMQLVDSQWIVMNYPCEDLCPEIEMISMKAGSFFMGKDDIPSAQPIHLVEVMNDFYVSKTEITVAQFRKCVNAGVCSAPKTCEFGEPNWTDIIGFQEDHPINCIDWFQARLFANWVGGDLLSEAQWEYVATSQGQMIIYPWGNDMASCALANIGSCQASTTPVCSYQNGNSTQGVCDLIGNVWEWVLDDWHSSYENAPSHEGAWCVDIGVCDQHESDFTIIRGGGCLDETNFVTTSSSRATTNPQITSSSTGFRIVRY
jgi:formylglycine-generating enzyme required for sulfatase activity